jgi:UDP-N-acetylmuramoyl-tripeptide--D-alanyl-D-alanine ligase
MNPTPLQEILQAIGGKALFNRVHDGGICLRSVSSDSRFIEPGAVFFAIRGEHVDGHDYLADAASKGAIAAVVDHEPKIDLPNLKFIVVPDTRKALGKLATYIRRQFGVCKVIAVAGSNGKTSTKHLISAALSAKLKGSISPKSYNNDIGVPLTIFPADPNQDYLVLEMGTNNPGEIRGLTNMARPDMGVITNCSAEHLEGLGDLMGVRQEEASLIEGIREGGMLAVNGDDPELVSAVRRFNGKVVRFGFLPSNDLFATDVQVHDNGTSFRLNDRNQRVFVPMIGRVNALNALAAIAIARRFGLTEEDFIAGLATSSKPEMRMQRLDINGVTILNDAYNANPASMKAGIETLLEFEPMGRHGKRIAVLGDMRELGTTSERYHREVGQLVASVRQEIDLLICVGPCSKWVAETAQSHGFDAPIKTFEDSALAAPVVARSIKRGDLVLVKGSRGMRLERIVEQLVGKGPVMKSVAG